MDWLQNPEFLARAQFGFIAMFHIMWPPLTIGLALVLFGMEAAWVKTKNVFYFHQVKFWTKLFLINFGVGVISGIPMEFSFGTNWGPFSTSAGDFMGNILGFETAMAFMLEAGFLGIMLFGWGRVGSKMHLFATGMVAFGSTLSAFWIMVANSWMQTPAGVKLVDGKFAITNWYDAVFNPDLPYGFGHMFTAAIELSLVVMAGVSAYYLLKKRHVDFFRPAFKWAVISLFIVAPLQIFIGDSAGSSLAETQPAKLAAIEAHWHTNKPGEGAPWALLAIPNQKEQKNDWALEIPDGLSMIVTKTMTGKVVGLDHFKPQDQPPVWIPFYGFRVMVAAGVFVAFMAFWTLWMLWRKRERMTAARISENKWLLRGWLLAVPAIYAAVEAGWMTREVGRQPWIVYGMMRTSQGVSNLPADTVLWSLAMYMLFYGVIGVTAFVFAARMIRKGPSFEDPPGAPGQGGKPEHAAAPKHVPFTPPVAPIAPASVSAKLAVKGGQ
ncbi:cytochrome ubiquinol oxidase subunit I [Thiomonas arsenitoxydans]|jgi:cytochrome d ubiquinol oxidase subunit I|uniref:cytochrome ubiquinol oxidase subunit I n=1 Tax=Thiomonas arsenitoxydans (strain DSM 22701 / CIP 110005 / 3As) TaxID=426114 RepID=UPI001AC9B31C|nr:cytochrome ubiquinol oxidase subunit I [Thiomonas arsenitoxydans]MBN8776365.1 cytochrome ubiquinol oxidase subunit I [Thiomonas arsenitoxydans]